MLLRITLFIALLYPTHGITNSILAIINDEYVISQHDLDKQINFLELLNKSPEFNNTIQMNDLVLNKMINNYLVVQDGKQYDIKISNGEIMATLAKSSEDLGISLEQLYKSAKNKGIEKDELLRLFTADMLGEYIQQNIISSRIKISNTEIEDEVSRFLSFNGKLEYHLFQISIYRGNKPQQDAEQLIQDIYDLLKQGANFQAIAEQFSEDNVSSNQGEVGWVISSYLPNEILNKVRVLEPNQHTAPTLIDNYYRIILLKDIRPLLTIDPANTDHMRRLSNLAREKLYFDKSQIAFTDYIKELYKNAYIEILTK